MSSITSGFHGVCTSTLRTNPLRTYVIAEDRFDLASDLMHKMFEFYIFGVAGNQVCSIKRRRCRTGAAGFKNRLVSGPLIVICQANTIKDINVRLDN